MNRRLAVLGAAIALDLAFGEPPARVHPVVAMGRTARWWECRSGGAGGRQPLLAGGALAMVVPGMAAAGGLAATAIARRLPLAAGIAAEAVLLKPAFAVRALFEHVDRVRRALQHDDFASARRATGAIVGRVVADLEADGLASAAIESLAENACDSVVAPWLWYAAGGTGAAWAYRAINTLDAVVGHRKKGRFGAPAARLDDLANLVPARATAVALWLAAGRRRGAARRIAGDAGRTPSPNSGWPMAAAAHALDVRLEKRGVHVLNQASHVPAAGDIANAERLVGAALGLFALALPVILLAGPRQ